jgi:HlyD family secretion protein
MKSKNPFIKFIFSFRMVALLVLIAAAAYVGWWYFGSKKEDIKYKTTEVMRSDIRSVISATGTIQAYNDTIDVGTQISGKIAKLYVDYNSVVRKGQLIAKIDSSQQVTDVNQAAATLASAQADLQSNLALLDKAQKDYARTKELSKRDLIARSEVDSGISSVSTARASVAASRAKIAQYSAALQNKRITLAYTNIYSPVDGVVIAKNVEEGQTVAASYSTPSIVEIARDLTKMQVKINVDEADIGGVKDGQVAEFTVDSYPNVKYKGYVKQIRLAPSSTDNVVTYSVIAVVDNKDKTLLPGMSANVSLILKECPDTLVVPNSAFRFRPVVQTQSKDDGGAPGMMRRKQNIAAVRKPTVYVIENGKPVKRNVEKGVTDGEFTQILSGVKEGERVITGIDLKKDNTANASS